MYIYIYIYIYVCVCVCVYLLAAVAPFGRGVVREREVARDLAHLPTLPVPLQDKI